LETPGDEQENQKDRREEQAQTESRGGEQHHRPSSEKAYRSRHFLLAPLVSKLDLRSRTVKILHSADDTVKEILV
jgi:hypothetical protein